MSDDDARTPMTPRHKLLFGLAGLAIVGLVGAWCWAVGAVFGPEAVDTEVFVVPDEGPASLFVRERATHLAFDPEMETLYTTRLAVYDVDTGARTSRRVLSWMSRNVASVTPIGLASQGVWLYDSSNGVQLVGTRDGAVLRGQDDLLAPEQAARRLRSGELDARVGYLPDSRALIVSLNTGEHLALSAEGAAATPHAAAVPPLELPGLPGTATTFPLGGDRHGRLIRVEGDATNGARIDVGSGPTGRHYFGAYFVQTGMGDRIVRADPKSVYVIHAATLEEDAEDSVSLVEFETGEPLWTAPLGGEARLKAAHATDTILCLVVRVDGDTVMLGLEHEGGTVRYRVDLD